ncbi:MAG: sugar phosphate isomerase/epimerase family protein [Phycisphaeraceae bacterium]
MADLIGADADPEQAAVLAARHGFEGLDLRLNRYDLWIADYGVERLADRMGELGLRPGYVSLMTRTLSGEEEEWREAMGVLAERAALAQRLGFTRAGVVVLPFNDERDTAANYRRHLLRLREAMPVLEDHGVRLGMEYVSPKTRRAGHVHSFIHTMKGMLQLIREAGYDGLGLMVDTLHWHCAGEGVEDLEALEAKDVVVVHLCDGIEGRSAAEQTVTERMLPGETGVFDNEGFVRGLRSIGYDGPMTAEPTSPRWKGMGADEAVGLTGAAVRRSLGLGVVSTQEG